MRCGGKVCWPARTTMPRYSTTRSPVAAAYTAGDDNMLPKSRSVSSYDAMDQVVQWFDAAHPNLHEIVIAGHSLGGQFTQYTSPRPPSPSFPDTSLHRRYAAVGKVLNLKGSLLPLDAPHI